MPVPSGLRTTHFRAGPATTWPPAGISKVSSALAEFLTQPAGQARLQLGTHTSQACSPPQSLLPWLLGPPLGNTPSLTEMLLGSPHPGHHVAPLGIASRWCRCRQQSSVGGSSQTCQVLPSQCQHEAQVCRGSPEVRLGPPGTMLCVELRPPCPGLAPLMPSALCAAASYSCICICVCTFVCMRVCT